jgi:transposase
MPQPRKLPSSLETDPVKINELLVGLPDVTVLGAVRRPDQSVELHIQTNATVDGCPSCGSVAQLKGWRVVTFADLPTFGSPVSLRWHKRRWCCPEASCAVGSWTEVDERIAGSRLTLTDRAARWATWEVGRNGRTVNEVAATLGCDWHTVNDAVLAFGKALVDHPERFGAVSSLGLDEHLFVKAGERRIQHFVTALVDVERGQLLDLVPDRRSDGPKRWILARGDEWRTGVRSGTLDLSATYRSVFDDVLPHARLVADKFHVVRHMTTKLDECRRRIQNETLGHRGRKHDPLYRVRRRLSMAAERFDENGREAMLGILRAGDPRGEVQAAWWAKEAVRELYEVDDHALAAQFIDELIDDMADGDWPVEVRSMGRTLTKWRDPIIAWHDLAISNGPTEAMNNLAKRIKRVGFGFRSFRNYRIRTLLYAGRPDWSLLPTLRISG